LLAIEGFRVLHGPVHHPFEHGKDIVALDAHDVLHAYQLKGGKVGLAELEAIMPQLLALAATPITYPGVSPTRRPDRAVLVTNGTLTPPARDRLAQFNAGNQQHSFTTIECIEYEHLLARFIASQADFIPAEPAELERLLRIYLGDGRTVFPVTDYLSVAATLIDDPVRSVGQSRRLHLSRAALLTSYMLTSWTRCENHLGIAQGWLSLCNLALERGAEGWEQDDWLPTYELCFAAARRALSDLLTEAHDAEDFVIPSSVDGFVYGARALLVCGYLAAFYRSEEVLDNDVAIRDRVVSTIKRESTYVRVFGEAGAPFIFLIADVAYTNNLVDEAMSLALLYTKDLIACNHPDRREGTPDPYHSCEEVLNTTLDPSRENDETHVGSAYTVITALEWFARRELRPAVELLWPDASKLTHLSFRISKPERIFAREDANGELFSMVPALTLSWSQFSADAGRLAETALPQVLWQHLEFLPFLPLLIPYRYSSDLCKAMDFAFGGLTVINFTPDGE
jgi:hypothetical protein